MVRPNCYEVGFGQQLTPPTPNTIDRPNSNIDRTTTARIKLVPCLWVGRIIDWSPEK